MQAYADGSNVLTIDGQVCVVLGVAADQAAILNDDIIHGCPLLPRVEGREASRDKDEKGDAESGEAGVTLLYGVRTRSNVLSSRATIW